VRFAEQDYYKDLSETDESTLSTNEEKKSFLSYPTNIKKLKRKDTPYKIKMGNYN